MKPTTLPNYAELDIALSQTKLKLHPSQVHGLICGLICGNPTSNAIWEELVTGNKEPSDAHELLQSLYDISADQLNEFLFELQLLLPSDSEPLPLRAEALTLWCQGILTGLKMAHVQMAEREPGELTEAMNDLVEIAKMNYDDVVPSEEDEEAYSELVEFVRMAVILVYQELHEAAATKKTASSSNHLH